MQQWDNILIEWINCLGISERVHKITDLHNGDFFMAILQMLSNYSHSNSIPENIEIFLELHYTKFQPPHKDVKDYSETDLSYICSLFMHYTCINDRRDSLTSPLCSKLATETQLAIKNFLEFFQNEQTFELYQNFIKTITKASAPSTPKSVNWQSSGDSPYVSNSPLQEFLKTPSRTTRNAERDRIIKNLKHELEMEKYEKEDLFIDLQEQKNKIKKLSNQVNEKSLMISKLREEINTLESQSTCQTPKDLKKIEKKLKSELRDSQIYIHQLQTEIDELEKANEQLELKLKKVEEDSCVWQLKGVTYETKYNDLNEKFHEQEMELNSLRENCNELRACLEEAFKKNQLSELDGSFSKTLPTFDCSASSEELACSVIEVQLRESQKENANLNITIKTLSDTNLELELNLNDVTVQLQDVTNNYKSLITSKGDLESKIIDMQASNHDLKEKNEKLSDSVENLNDKLLVNEEEIQELKHSLDSCNKTIEERNLLLESLEKDLSNAKEGNEQFEIVLEKRNIQMEALQNESKALEAKLNDALENFTKKSFECDSLQNLYNKLDENIESNLRNLEKLLYGCNDHAFDDKIQTFKVFLEKIDNENRNKLIEIDNYECKIKNSNEIICKLEEQISLLTKQDIADKESIENLSKCLQISNQKLHELEDFSKVQEDKIYQLNDTINDLNINIRELEGVKSLLTIENSNLENTVADYLQERTSYLKEVKTLKSRIEQNEKCIQQLNVDLSISIDNYNLKVSKLEELESMKMELMEEHESQLVDLSKQMEDLKDTASNLENELKSAHLQNSDFKELLQQRVLEYSQLGEEKSIYVNQCEELKKNLLDITEKLSQKENLCGEKNDILSKLNRELLSLKLELETKHKEIECMKEKCNELQDEKDDAHKDIKSLNEKCVKMDNQISDLTNERDQLEHIKDDLTYKSHKLEESLFKALSEYDIECNDLHKGINDLLEYRLKVENQIKELKNENVEANNLLNQANEKQANDNNINIKQKEVFENTISVLNGEIDSLKAQEISYIEDLDNLKDELNYMVTKYTETLQTQKEQKCENEVEITSLTENLHNMIEKFNLLDGKHSRTIEELDYTKESLESITLEKQEVEMELVKCKQQFEEDSTAAAEQYKTELNILSEKKIKLEKDLEMLNKTLAEEKSSKILLEKGISKTQIDLDGLLEEKSDLLAKIESVSQIKLQFEKNYNELNIEHENYIKENQVTLSKIQNKLKEAIKDIADQKLYYEDQAEKLQLLNEKLREEIDQKNKLYDEFSNKKNEEIESLQSKIKQNENHLSQLQVEQEALIEEMKSDYEALEEDSNVKSQHMIALEEKLAKLQYIFDILELGKLKVEEMHKDMEEKYIQLEGKHNESFIEHQSQIIKLEEKVDELQSIIDENVGQLNEKDAKIIEYSRENEKITQVLNILQSDYNNEMSVRECLSRQLEIIEEDNEKVLSHELCRFKHVKAKYEQIKKELTDIQRHYSNIQHELEEKDILYKKRECEVMETQSTLRKVQKMHDEIKSGLENQQTTILSLQEELEGKLVQIETLAWEKRNLELRVAEYSEELEKLNKAHDDILSKHRNLMSETEENLLRAHESAIDVKNDLINRIESAERNMQDEKKLRMDIENLLHCERERCKFFELQLLEVTNDKLDLNKSIQKMKDAIEKLTGLIHEKQMDISDDESLSEIMSITEERIVQIFINMRQLNEVIGVLEKDKSDISHKLDELKKCNDDLHLEKDNLIHEFRKLQNDKEEIIQERDKESKCLENLKVQYNILKDKMNSMEFSNHSKLELEEKFSQLQAKSTQITICFDEFVENSKTIKAEVDNLLTKRNALDGLIINLRDLYLTMEVKSIHLNEDNYKLHFEQKQALETVIDDIQKQFNRLTKIAYNKSLSICQIFEKTVSGIINDKLVDFQVLFNDLGINEVYEKVDDLYDNTQNILEQLKTFTKSLDLLNLKSDKKENILREQNQLQTAPKPKEDEWKKKYMNVKQRLTLVENAKNNYEKKIKQLREDNAKLQKREPDSSNKENNVMFMEQLNKMQQEKEKIISSYEQKLNDVLGEVEQYKLQLYNARSEAHHDNKIELGNIRDAYVLVKSDLSKVELENGTLRKLLDDRNTQIGELLAIKEAYEKLFEDNNKLLAEVDTLKYKRTRDREEFVRLIKKEKEESDRKIQEVRNEYELKLEKMKEKMMKLYKDEIDKLEKVVSEKDDNLTHLRMIEKLQDELTLSHNKIKKLNEEKAVALHQLDIYHRMDRNSRDSIRSVDSALLLRRDSSLSLASQEHMRGIDDRRYSTLPRSVSGMDVIEEVHIRRRTSVHNAQPNLEMEDEGDEFNNKYLVDLKEGKCPLNTGRESTSSRLSELAFRNSLCPPHLKSSYAAETQFLNPRRFKDDDLKSGNIDLDDSMSTRLLPMDKPKKKDIGTTSYKRPGPPTPSKNGGRTSLQGNEREYARELNDTKTPKRTTPNRLKSLFSRSKDASESTSNTTPKAKRLSIFRKPR